MKTKYKKITQKENSSIREALHDAPEQTISYNSVDAAFQSKELFLIGFATILVAWAWVSIFSLLIPNTRGIGYANSHPLRVAVLDMGRNISDEIMLASQSVNQAAGFVTQASVYQVVALLDSACSFQEHCDVSLQSQKEMLRMAFERTSGALTDMRFLRLPQEVSYLVVSNTSHTVVLGDSTVDPSLAATEVLQVGRCYINTITGGLLSAIDMTANSCE